MNTKTARPNLSPEYLESQGLSADFPKRWISKVQITETHWLWIGSTRPCSNINPKGHGMIQRRPGINCKIYAHRAAWILFRGPIPDGKMVLHNCPDVHVPYCVRPDHLKLGDGFENMKDMTKAGNNHFSKHPFRGEEHGMAKLTKPQIDEMREKYYTGEFFLRELASQYGVSIGHVWNVVHRKTWDF